MGDPMSDLWASIITSWVTLGRPPAGDPMGDLWVSILDPYELPLGGLWATTVNPWENHE